MNAIIITGILLVLAFVWYKNTQKPNAQLEEEAVKGTIFYHEDDFCQVQILPAENLPELIKQATNVKDFADQHSTESGKADMMVREASSIRLAQCEISAAALEKILAKMGSERHPEVMTGYGSSHRVKSNNTIAFGKDYSAIYFNHKDNVVENIWMTNVWVLDPEKVADVLHELGTKWNLLLMDWNDLKLIDLKNKSQIDNYLK